MSRAMSIEGTTYYSPDEVEQEDRHLWLRRDEERKQHPNDTVLIKDQAIAVPKGQKKYGKLTAPEEKSQQEKRSREKLLRFYPQLKRGIHKLIKQCGALAELADQVQKKCSSAAKIVKFTKVPCMILGGTGAVLSLYTGPVGLAVSAIGASLMSPALFSKLSKNAKAKKLKSTAIKLAENIKEFVATAKKQIKEANVSAGANKGLYILEDIERFVQDTEGLLKQINSESCERLRQSAQELENKLVELQQVWEKL